LLVTTNSTARSTKPACTLCSIVVVITRSERQRQEKAVGIVGYVTLCNFRVQPEQDIKENRNITADNDCRSSNIQSFCHDQYSDSQIPLLIG